MYYGAPEYTERGKGGTLKVKLVVLVLKSFGKQRCSSRNLNILECAKVRRVRKGRYIVKPSYVQAS